ncbi:MAG: sulfatase-like hydrolase/transferase, partial [Lewinella sp.]|nr:sulfatase-like hydrolase/transferase [Lewinella sp.]
MKKHFFGILVFVIWAVNTCYSQNLPGSSRPNIIFIMTDDHANRAMSCYGSDLIRTPNMDRIAREGMRFDNSFVTNSI